MAALAHLVGLDRHTPRLSALAAKLGTALRRTAAERYAERCERVESTGTAGMI